MGIGVLMIVLEWVRVIFGCQGSSNMNIEEEFRFLYTYFLQNLIVTNSAAESLGENNSEFGYRKEDLLVYLDVLGQGHD